MNIFNQLDFKLTAIRKFYFLEYFNIFLKSVERNSDPKEVFNMFKVLKESYQLGESKYKKLGQIFEELTEKQLNRYKYTFNEILEESEVYKLIYVTSDSIHLTENGKNLLSIIDEQGYTSFYEALFKLMEDELNGFYYLIENCYRINPQKGGLLIFPIYSPPFFGLTKSQIKTSRDIYDFCQKVFIQIELDIKSHLNREIPLAETNDKLIQRLVDSKLIKLNGEDTFQTSNYNKILKRIRDFWLNHFLKDVYEINLSLSYFDIWSVRAKQLGIVNTTEFYPDFNGRIVYPISVLSNNNKVNRSDFRRLQTYRNGQGLYIHEPRWDSFMEKFVEVIYSTYHDLKHYHNTYFVNLLDLRDVACFKMKISIKTFTEFLANSYQLNLKDELRIRISLEADKLPEETKALYLKREPIVIDGKSRNIIAIDLK